jgi:hypothetical protein
VFESSCRERSVTIATNAGRDELFFSDISGSPAAYYLRVHFAPEQIR